VIGDAHRLGRATQRIFYHHGVLALAQDHADARSVVGVAKLVVSRRQIEVHLAGELGLELLDFEVDHHEAAQAEMVEEEVDVVILTGHLEVVLAADKGEALSKLEDQGADVFQQAAFKLALRHLGAECQEVEAVGVFDELLGKFRLRGAGCGRSS